MDLYFQNLVVSRKLFCIMILSCQCRHFKRLSDKFNWRNTSVEHNSWCYKGSLFFGILSTSLVLLHSTHSVKPSLHADVEHMVFQRNCLLHPQRFLCFQSTSCSRREGKEFLLSSSNSFIWVCLSLQNKICPRNLE